MLRQTSGQVRALAAVMKDAGLDLHHCSDESLYEGIISAIQFDELGRTDVEASESCVGALVERLASGWFAERRPDSPQGWYSRSGNLFGSPVLVSHHGGADKPVTPLWTSSLFPGGSSAWSLMEEITGPSGRRSLWRISFDEADHRVYRIDDWSDYRDLVQSYPSSNFPGYLTVDWPAVSCDFDAVHLSVNGLIATAGVRESESGRAVSFSGWDAECTAWFRIPHGIVRELVAHGA